MTTNEDINRLYKKFDDDKEKRHYVFRVLLAIDQFFNVVLWNGSQDQTISSHIHRRQVEGRSNWFDDSVCWVLRKIESKHCMKSKFE